MIDLDHWDYALPPDRIARHPLPERDASRLMVVERSSAAIDDRRFTDLPDLLRPGDLLVANDTRVMPARLRARRATGGEMEVLILSPETGPVDALLRPGRRVHAGEVLELIGGGAVRVIERRGEGFRVEILGDPVAIMDAQGEIPLPPYLGRDEDPDDRARYQTVYAGPLGACAAPTAGLHFTPALIERLAARDIGFATVTLHVGIGTFRPPRPEDLEAGRLHEEPYAIPAATVDAIAQARARGSRVIAVGTTSARALETATPEGERVPAAGAGRTDLLVAPGRPFRAVDALITNFHLPRSSLLLLVGALIGRERVLASYAAAVDRGYRFYSYGDAMLIL